MHNNEWMRCFLEISVLSLKNERHLCLVLHICTKLSQNVCLINTQILVYWHAKCNCKLWKALWFYCIFGYFHTLLTSIHVWSIVSSPKFHRLCVWLMYTFFICIFYFIFRYIVWQCIQSHMYTNTHTHIHIHINTQNNLPTFPFYRSKSIQINAKKFPRESWKWTNYVHILLVDYSYLTFSWLFQLKITRMKREDERKKFALFNVYKSLLTRVTFLCSMLVKS